MNAVRKGSLKTLLIVTAMLIVLSACTSAAGQNGMFTFEKQPLAKGDVTAFVVANGVVKPARSATLTWKTSGQVDEVLVSTLEETAENQQVATLLESSLPTNILSARLDLIEAQRALSDLKVSRTNAEQAKLTLVEAREALEKATTAFTSVSGDKRYVSESYIDGTRAEIIIAESEVDKAQNYYDHLAGKGDDDPETAAALKVLSQTKQARDRAYANLNYLLGSPTQKEFDKAEAELSLAQARLDDAQRAYDRVKDGVPAEDLAALETRIKIAEATLEQPLLLSPFSGTVTSIISREGDLVQPGSAAITIEDQSRLYVDAQVSEIDVNRISIGQYVEVSFDAVWGRTFSAKVIEIGISGSNAQGVVNFPVRIELIDLDPSIKTGMTAVLRVQVQEVTDVLLVPNQSVRVQDGQRVVFIDKGGPVPEAVPVTLGVSSDTMSEVLEGDLKVGDLVITNPDMLIMQSANVQMR